jgi:hypothetical protein
MVWKPTHQEMSEYVDLTDLRFIFVSKVQIFSTTPAWKAGQGTKRIKGLNPNQRYLFCNHALQGVVWAPHEHLISANSSALSLKSLKHFLGGLTPTIRGIGEPRNPKFQALQA